ncbi:uncharacterized protein LOC142590663 isoform X4 [Dermacentor variabilis]|uniref:uncharacterized protein LOC142590663 isoform X4 n=1 Tax=Dermacentor variabilis TaxID=34621 RepID=UPI003F5C47C5
MSETTDGSPPSAAAAAAAAKRAARAEAQRRRRQNPEVRAAEAEAYRRRRRDDPGVRVAEAEAKRRRREDPAVRAAEAEAHRRRREDPAVRAAEAEAHRRRREDPAVRAAEAEAHRRRREQPAVSEAEAEAHRRRREDSTVRAAEAEAKRKQRLANRFLCLNLSKSNADPAAPTTARCVVPVCHSRSAPSSILYPLPAEPSQRQAWIDFVRGCPCGGACDWNPPTNEISFVCSLHFKVRCFRFQRPRGGSASYRKRLKRGAVPTLYPIEEQCSSTANKNSPDNTAERLASSAVEDAERRTRNSLASRQSVTAQGHRASDVELIFPRDISTQCSVEMASKAASCFVRTLSKSVQCSG